MTIHLACGCVTEKYDDGRVVSYKGSTCVAIDGYSNAVVSGFYCAKCEAELEKEGLLLKTDEEEDAWLAEGDSFRS